MSGSRRNSVNNRIRALGTGELPHTSREIESFGYSMGNLLYALRKSVNVASDDMGITIVALMLPQVSDIR